MSPVESVIEILGSKAELARRCGVKPQAITQWTKPGRVVPANRCLAIESATGGRVSRYDLRPDVFGEAIDELSEKNGAA